MREAVARQAERSPIDLTPLEDAAVVERSPYLTVAEAAQQLRVHRQLIYRMVQRGELPGTLRVGRHIRIPQAAIDALRASVA